MLCCPTCGEDFAVCPNCGLDIDSDDGQVFCAGNGDPEESDSIIREGCGWKHEYDECSSEGNDDEYYCFFCGEYATEK